MNKDNDILMENVDERIESFLRGTMSAEEEAVFKQEIKNSPELRSRAIAMASLIKGIRANEAEKEKTVLNSVEKNNKSKMRPVLWWACSIAAVFAIIFGVYKDRRYRMLDSTISPYYTQYDVADITRGETDSVAIAHLYSLFNQIPEKRNVAAIIRELESIYNSIDNDYTYYPFANDIFWNLALAYVKNDEIDKAILVLEKLKRENPETPLAVKVQELLKKIKIIQKRR